MRAAVRYALWMVVLVKLLVPPTFSSPTSLAWWTRPTIATEAVRNVVVTTEEHPTSAKTAVPVASPVVPAPKLSVVGWTADVYLATAIFLVGWMAFQWQVVRREIRRASPATAALDNLLAQARQTCGVSQKVEVRLTNLPISPALCGLWHPVIPLTGHSHADRSR